MNLKLIRTEFTDTTTLGELYVDGTYFSYILEDKDRGLDCEMSLDEIKSIKIHGQTCIPYGRYEIVISYSDRFKTYLPLLIGVPGYAGIRMHPGNDSDDTDGCLLPGEKSSPNYVINSKSTFKKLFAKLKAVERKEKIFIEITK